MKISFHIVWQILMLLGVIWNGCFAIGFLKLGNGNERFYSIVFIAGLIYFLAQLYLDRESDWKKQREFQISTRSKN